MSRSQVGELLADRRYNAVVAWALVAFLVAVVVGSVVEGDLLWAGFVAVVAALAVVPPVAYRDLETMLPWEVLAMATLPALGRVLATVELTSRLATYLAVAAVALVVAVELHVFTPVEMTYGFAVLFVVVTTMATAGVWAVARWAVEVLAGIPVLYPGLDDAAAHEAVMLEFVYSTAAGILAGVVFELYFRRRARIEERVPEEVRELV